MAEIQLKRHLHLHLHPYIYIYTYIMPIWINRRRRNKEIKRRTFHTDTGTQKGSPYK